MALLKTLLDIALGRSNAKTAPVVPVMPHKRKLSEAELLLIPRYPPFPEGLPILEPDNLLCSHADIIDLLEHFVADKKLFEEQYMPAMIRFASFVHLLPASQTHHHRGAGGLLRHSLEVGIWAVRSTYDRLIRGVTDPQERRLKEPRWRLAIFLAGLCHDLGKVATDFSVTDRNATLLWDPYEYGVYQWAVENNVQSYFLHWNDERGRKHIHHSASFKEDVIPKAVSRYIREGGMELMSWLLDSVNGHPNADNQIHDFVMQADQRSVERDLRTMGTAMAGYSLGTPVEHFLLEVMRQLVKEGVWGVNEPGARVWVIEGQTYLVWPKGGEEIAERIRENDVAGLPKTSDGILQMMIERGIASMLDAEHGGFYLVAPDMLTAKIPDFSMRAIKLKDQALVISTLPVDSVPGLVFDAKTAVKNHPVADDKGGIGYEVQDQNAPVFIDTPVTSLSNPVTLPTPVAVDQISAQAESQTPQIPSPASVQNIRSQELYGHGERPSGNDLQRDSKEHGNQLRKEQTREALNGMAGAILLDVISDFKSGKKSYHDLVVQQGDNLHFLWEAAFAGCGFSANDVITEFTKRKWIERADKHIPFVKVRFNKGNMSNALKFNRAVSLAILGEVGEIADANTVSSKEPSAAPNKDRSNQTSLNPAITNKQDLVVDRLTKWLWLKIKN